MDNSDKQLQNFLRHSLQNILSKNYIALLTADKNIPALKHAFVHKTVSQTANYETLEKIGDALLKANFNLNILKKYPNTDQHVLTILQNYFLATDFLAHLNTKYKLEHYIQSKISVTDKIREDVFEAFIGVLAMVGNSIKDGLGILIAYDFVNHVFEHENVNPADYRKYEPKKTRLKELYDSNKWGEVEYYNTSSKMPKRHFSSIIKDRIVIGSGESHTLVKAQNMAAENALKLFSLDTSLSRSLRFDDVLNNPKYRHLSKNLDSAFHNARNSDYKVLYQKKNADYVFTLLAKGSSDDPFRVITQTYGKNADQSEEHMVDEFIQKYTR
jgi:ribonuclease-3